MPPHLDRARLSSSHWEKLLQRRSLEPLWWICFIVSSKTAILDSIGGSSAADWKAKWFSAASTKASAIGILNSPSWMSSNQTSAKASRSRPGTKSFSSLRSSRPNHSFEVSSPTASSGDDCKATATSIKMGFCSAARGSSLSATCLLQTSLTKTTIKQFEIRPIAIKFTDTVAPSCSKRRCTKS